MLKVNKRFYLFKNDFFVNRNSQRNDSPVFHFYDDIRFLIKDGHDLRMRNQFLGNGLN